MTPEYENFMSKEFRSKAIILDSRTLEVTTIDGEKYQVISEIGRYLDEETRNYMLHQIEAIFDNNFSEDRELMFKNIWLDATLHNVHFSGVFPGDRERERTRIGNRIKQIREEKGIEARELAKLAGIDPANLSRIENGRYSVGFDILSKIAASLGMKIDLVNI